MGLVVLLFLLLTTLGGSFISQVFGFSHYSTTTYLRPRKLKRLEHESFKQKKLTSASKRATSSTGIISSIRLTMAQGSKSDTSTVYPTLIDYQSSDKYGRGDQHLTAALHEGDIIVYQTGTWLVDGVAVGDGTWPPHWEYCLVDTIQIVWSHNCEHGVVRGFPVELLVVDMDEDQDNAHDGSDDSARTRRSRQLLRANFDEMIDFGPEQLVARIPIQEEDAVGNDAAIDGSFSLFRPLVGSPLSNKLWETTLPVEEEES